MYVVCDVFVCVPQNHSKLNWEIRMRLKLYAFRFPGTLVWYYVKNEA